MMKFNREEGLTLIELLITIAVLAIVAAIAIPVVTNVVNSTEDRAVTQTNSDIADFTSKYNNVGKFDYTDATQTFTGWVDLDGDGTADSGESIETLVIDSSVFTVQTGADGSEVDAVADETGSFDSDSSTRFTVRETN